MGWLGHFGNCFFFCHIHFPSFDDVFWHSDSATQHIVGVEGTQLRFSQWFSWHKEPIWSPINIPQMCKYMKSTPGEKYNWITTLNCSWHHGSYLVTYISLNMHYLNILQAWSNSRGWRNGCKKSFIQFAVFHSILIWITTWIVSIHCKMTVIKNVMCSWTIGMYISIRTQMCVCVCIYTYILLGRMETIKWSLFIHMLTQAICIKYILCVKHCTKYSGSNSLNISLHSKWEEGYC